jgi:hypothetical protein
MRLIDAESFKAQLIYLASHMQDNGYSTYASAVGKIISILDRRQTIDVTTKWISVKERLPNEPGEYLASSNEYVTVLEFKGGKWHDINGSRYFVDAWMQKPEGYKQHDWDGESDDDSC